MKCIFCPNIEIKTNTEHSIKCEICSTEYFGGTYTIKGKEYETIMVYNNPWFEYSCAIRKIGKPYTIRLNYIPDITPFNVDEKCKVYVSFS